MFLDKNNPPQDFIDECVKEFANKDGRDISYILAGEENCQNILTVDGKFKVLRLWQAYYDKETGADVERKMARIDGYVQALLTRRSLMDDYGYTIPETIEDAIDYINEVDKQCK